MMSERCFCCDAVQYQPAANGWVVCTWCGAKCKERRAHDKSGLRRELEDRLQPGAVVEYGADDWFVDAYTYRIAAGRKQLWFEAEGQGFIDGHDDRRPKGMNHQLGNMSRLPVTLIVLSRTDGPELDEFLQINAPRFSEVVVMLDRAASPTQSSCIDKVAILERPLAGNFAAQRNAGQEAATCDWTFHLDLDETIRDRFASDLGSIAAMAQAANLRAVGFPRSNRVGGVASNLFPDTQYRLVRSDVRFEGHVHERPDACADWPTTSVWLGGHITHHLSRARVEERSRLYAGMGQQSERHDDDLRLFEEYAP